MRNISERLDWLEKNMEEIIKEAIEEGIKEAIKEGIEEARKEGAGNSMRKFGLWNLAITCGGTVAGCMFLRLLGLMVERR